MNSASGMGPTHLNALNSSELFNKERRRKENKKNLSFVTLISHQMNTDQIDFESKI